MTPFKTYGDRIREHWAIDIVTDCPFRSQFDRTLILTAQFLNNCLTKVTL